MTRGQMDDLSHLLTLAEKMAEQRREEEFDDDNPGGCRKWLMRRDHFREAQSAVRSMIAEAKCL